LRGDKVIATARTLATITHLAAAGASILQLDVTSPFADLQETANEAIAIHGQIDVLVNNAGYSHFGTVEDAS
jgi:NAD(P)-dependent dehydrogenase (short-subunit alcohol dehydrogenase family)